MIFLSLRFYVKSIFEILKVLKLPFFAILGPMNSVNLVNFRPSKSAKIQDLEFLNVLEQQILLFLKAEIDQINHILSP